MQFNFLSFSNVELSKLCLQVRVGLQLDKGLRDRSLEGVCIGSACLNNLRTHLESKTRLTARTHDSWRLENIITPELFENPSIDWKITNLTLGSLHTREVFVIK